MNKIILGGGIAGLIWAYFHPEYIIISKEIGGQFKSPFSLGPKYLHVDKYSKRFLEEEIGYKINPIKKIKIGFFYDGEVHSKNTEENRIRYFKKTRGLDIPYESAMSADKTEFSAYEWDPETLADTIIRRLNNTVIKENVKKISIENQELETETGKIKYSDLVSTIPLNVFLNLTGKEKIAKKFKSYPTTFILSNSWIMPWQQRSDTDPFEDYDYVYVSEPDFRFHRVTKTDRGLVYEYKRDDIEKFDFEIDRVVLKVGQLIENDLKIDFQHIKFFGRYGTWKHEVKVNELLKEIYETKTNL